MPRTQPEPPRISVKNRTEVTLSPAEVEHALRCWLYDKLVSRDDVPKPRLPFSDIQVHIDLNGLGSDLDTPVFGGATLTYEPALAEPAPELEPPEPDDRSGWAESDGR